MDSQNHHHQDQSPAPTSDLRLRSSNAASDDPPRFESPAAGARYKLLSPAKLPISRSPCITIPPGLSPTSFLESPVLLSNMKVEPSPTTGSFAKTQMAMGSNVFSSTSCSDSYDDRQSSCFEFKPHGRSNMVPADVNQQRSEQSIQFQSQWQPQSFPSSPSVRSEMAGASNELSLSSPVQAGIRASGSADVDTDELDQKGTAVNGIHASHSDHKGSGPQVAAERLADDGYNWRKYGQKHVKGSEFPRSYYKCTHPNCEVKKLFERSHDGQITEIIYKGTHDHPKPQLSRRYNAGNSMPIQEERSERVSSVNGLNDHGQLSHDIESNGTLELSPGTANDDSVHGTGLLSNRIHEEADDDDDPFSKRRRMNIGGIDVTSVVKPIREPRVVVQTLSEVDILDDGYRWRKYGQKVVRGNPNPRSYYKCTYAGCPVRKHVERASHDPKAVITTYEGKHNHDVPTTRTSSHDMAGPHTISGQSRIRSGESEAISLDLGVGINSSSESRSSEHQQTMRPEFVQMQTNPNGSSFKVTQSTPVSAYFSALNASMNQYGSRENHSDDRSVDIPSLNHSSYPYPQNVGRILTGP